MKIGEFDYDIDWLLGNLDEYSGGRN